MSCSRTAFFHILRSTKVAFLRGGGRIPFMGLGGGGNIPLFQCAVLSLEGNLVRVAIDNAAITGSRVLVLVDVMIFFFLILFYFCKMNRQRCLLAGCIRVCNRLSQNEEGVL